MFTSWTLGLAAEGAKIEVAAKKQITSVDSRHPEIVRAKNGDLVIAFSGTKGTGHDNALQHVMCMTSCDDGATWSEVIDIYPLDGNNEKLRKDPYLIVAPNGDIICSFTNPHQKNTGSYSISSDNGKTWTYKGLISPDPDLICRRFTGGDVVGNTIYACGETFEWETVKGLPATFWKSDDNGLSWKSVCDKLDDATINEWDVLALTESHFIAVARTYPTGGKTLFFESEDAGKNWSVPVDISAMTGVVQDPNLEWLNKSAGTIILHGRRQSWEGFDARSAFWISRDSGVTWTDYTPVTSQNTMDEYSGFAEYDGEPKGYLLWGENTRLFGSMVSEVRERVGDDR